MLFVWGCFTVTVKKLKIKLNSWEGPSAPTPWHNLPVYLFIYLAISSGQVLTAASAGGRGNVRVIMTTGCNSQAPPNKKSTTNKGSTAFSVGTAADRVDSLPNVSVQQLSHTEIIQALYVLIVNCKESVASARMASNAALLCAKCWAGIMLTAFTILV